MCHLMTPGPAALTSSWKWYFDVVLWTKLYITGYQNWWPLMYPSGRKFKWTIRKTWLTVLEAPYLLTGYSRLKYVTLNWISYQPSKICWWKHPVQLVLQLKPCHWVTPPWQWTWFLLACHRLSHSPHGRSAVMIKYPSTESRPCQSGENASCCCRHLGQLVILGRTTLGKRKPQILLQNEPWLGHVTHRGTTLNSFRVPPLHAGLRFRKNVGGSLKSLFGTGQAISSNVNKIIIIFYSCYYLFIFYYLVFYLP